MKPAAMIYCQHSLGLGHFVRSMTLARAMTEVFDVTFLSGGRPPSEVAIPAGVRFEPLPPVSMEVGGVLTAEAEVATVFAARRARMLDLASEIDPRLLLVELYPFGRKKFAVEIDPLIDAVRARGGKVACSVRDVLVNGKEDQARHDDAAATKLNALFNLVLVHSDERIFRIEDSFCPRVALQPPLVHTGYVSQPIGSVGPAGSVAAEATLVTAGGGAVGHDLYRAALQAQPRLWAARRWPMHLVAGPLFPEPDWRTLVEQARTVPGLRVEREVVGMAASLRAAGRVVSQCGYNSALEIVQAGIPALFVPFARERETEQTARAERFRGLGLCEWVAEQGLDGAVLAERLMRLRVNPDRARLNMDGAAVSAELLKRLAA